MGLLLITGSHPELQTAAQRAGHLVFLLDDEGPVQPYDAAYCARFHGGDPREVERAAAVLLRGLRPGSVMAGQVRGILPGAILRARLGVPGSSGRTARLLDDRHLLLRTLRAAGIPVPDSAQLSGPTSARLLLEKATYPVTVRPCRATEERAVQVGSRAEVRALADRWLDSEPELMVVADPPGRRLRLEVALLNGQPVFEALLDLEADGELVAPSAVPVAQAAALVGLARRALGLVGLLRGWACVDLTLNANGGLVTGVRGTPPDAGTVALLSSVYSLAAWNVALDVEMGKAPAVQRDARRIAVMRPILVRPGLVRTVAGLEAARGIRGVCEVQLDLTPGQRVSAPGDGVPGQGNAPVPVGRLVAIGDTHAAGRELLMRAHEKLRLDIDTEAPVGEPTREVARVRA